LFALALTAAAALADGTTAAGELDSPALVIANRTIVQDRGDWQVDYRLRYSGQRGLIVTTEEVLVLVEGWVSNSRVPGHGAPRWSAATISGPSRLQAVSEVIASEDEEKRCLERASVRIWAEDAAGRPVGRVLDAGGAVNPGPDTPAAVVSVAPGSILRVQLRLEHQHVVHGNYDPLLGMRSVELRLGPTRVTDALPMDREQHVAQPPRAVFNVPEEHRDTQYYRSAPDSLHIAVHTPGGTYFRFVEIPVRYDTKMRLRFSYLIAAGTQGTCRARITQFKDSAVAWKVLTDGRRELPLTAVGRWTQVEVVFRTEPRATTLALDFRIEGEEVEMGEFWVDDVSLEPVGAPAALP
jgi:hypothetical protein